MFLPGGPEVKSRAYAEETQRLIDKEVARLLREAEERATKLLSEHRDALDRLTELLLENETIDGETVYEIVGRPVPGGRPQVLAASALNESDAERLPAQPPDRGARS
jgi:cell division protease FtsH